MLFFDEISLYKNFPFVKKTMDGITTSLEEEKLLPQPTDVIEQLSCWARYGFDQSAIHFQGGDFKRIYCCMENLHTG